MSFFSGLFRRGKVSDGLETVSEAQVRLSRVARQVSEALEGLDRLSRKVAQLEAEGIDRSAALLNAADKVNRALDRYRKSRPRNGAGDDERDEPDDWLRGYHALRGRGPFASQAGPLGGDDDDDDQDDGDVDGFLDR